MIATCWSVENVLGNEIAPALCGFSYCGGSRNTSPHAPHRQWSFWTGLDWTASLDRQALVLLGNELVIWTGVDLSSSPLHSSPKRSLRIDKHQWLQELLMRMSHSNFKPVIDLVKQMPCDSQRKGIVTLVQSNIVSLPAVRRRTSTEQ